MLNYCLPRAFVRKDAFNKVTILSLSSLLFSNTGGLNFSRFVAGFWAKIEFPLLLSGLAGGACGFKLSFESDWPSLYPLLKPENPPGCSDEEFYPKTLLFSSFGEATLRFLYEERGPSSISFCSSFSVFTLLNMFLFVGSAVAAF